MRKDLRLTFERFLTKRLRERLGPFLILFLASFIATLLSLLWTFWFLPWHPSHMASMGGMMGLNPWLGGWMPAYWLPFGLGLLSVVSLILLLYHITADGPAKMPLEEGRGKGEEEAYQVILRSLKPDEAKVMNVLRLHGGRYLQKYISKEAGLSRLKTHRIITRFAERGMVEVKKKANTKEVILAPWLLKKPEE